MDMNATEAARELAKVLNVAFTHVRCSIEPTGDTGLLWILRLHTVEALSLRGTQIEALAAFTRKWRMELQIGVEEGGILTVDATMKVRLHEGAVA